MRHEQILDHLSDYVEGNLDAAMSAAVELHTKNCADCYRELTLMRQVYEELGNPGLMMEPPGRFHDDVMRKVRLYNQGAAADQGFFSRFRWGWVSILSRRYRGCCTGSLTTPAKKPDHRRASRINRNRVSAPAPVNEKAPCWLDDPVHKTPPDVTRSPSAGSSGPVEIDGALRKAYRWRTRFPLATTTNRLLWQGEASGNRDTFIILQAKSAGAGSVSEVLVELEQTDQAGKTQRSCRASRGGC